MKPATVEKRLLTGPLKQRYDRLPYGLRPIITTVVGIVCLLGNGISYQPEPTHADESGPGGLVHLIAHRLNIYPADLPTTLPSIAADLSRIATEGFITFHEDGAVELNIPQGAASAVASAARNIRVADLSDQQVKNQVSGKLGVGPRGNRTEAAWNEAKRLQRAVIDGQKVSLCGPKPDDESWASYNRRYLQALEDLPIKVDGKPKPPVAGQTSFSYAVAGARPEGQPMTPSAVADALRASFTVVGAPVPQVQAGFSAGFGSGFQTGFGSGFETGFPSPDPFKEAKPGLASSSVEEGKAEEASTSDARASNPTPDPEPNPAANPEVEPTGVTQLAEQVGRVLKLESVSIVRGIPSVARWIEELRLTPEQVVEVATKKMRTPRKPGYEAPRSLGYLDNAMAEYRRALDMDAARHAAAPAAGKAPIALPAELDQPWLGNREREFMRGLVEAVASNKRSSASFNREMLLKDAAGERAYDLALQHLDGLATLLEDEWRLERLQKKLA